MIDQFCFQIFTANRQEPFDLQIKNLESQLIVWTLEESLSFSGLLQSRIYLSDASNQWESVLHSSLYRDLLSQGAISFVEQPLLSGAKIALQVWFSKNPDIEKSGTPDCLTIKENGVTFLFQSVRFAKDEVANMNSEEQTMLAFRRHMDVLREQHMNLEQHCHRTWIYVRDIDRHYGGVVEGRNKVFAQNGLTAESHFIASTGIGGFTDNSEAIVGIDFLSVNGISRDDVQYLHALDFLNPTHEYGVAFERGTKISLPQGNLFFISGTASIDKYGDCLHRGDVLTQAGRLFLNIEKLLEDGGASLSDLQYFIVYLRDIADYHSINTYLSLRFPSIPYLITEARVCRPEWLIEVEGIAGL